MLGLYKTTDAGTTWTTAATSPNPLGGQGWYDNSITVHNTGPNIVVVADLIFMYPTNGGTTLTKKLTGQVFLQVIFLMQMFTG
jgi:hypothetical protein